MLCSTPELTVLIWSDPGSRKLRHSDFASNAPDNLPAARLF